MTKQQVRERVNGYTDATSDAAFERMFERDKDLLREMGVPLVVEHDQVHEDDVGYRIDTAGYTLPEVAFTPAEVGVLSLAAELWQDASLRSSARRGMTKLRAVGPAAEPAAHAGLALRVRGPEASFAPLLEAIDTRQVVTFTYRAASTGQLTRRRVEPWRLLSQDRGWYLVGRDVDRAAPRAFRLSRIQGRVRPTGSAEAFDVPVDVDVAALVGGARPVSGTARLAVLPGRAAALRARAGSEPDGDDVAGLPGPLADREIVVVPFYDLEDLAEEIAAYAEAVLVLEPADLRTAVLRRLRAAATLDGSGSDG
ncbi:WYL domain-containing protein [Georgenia subflava]|uniref:WYL domain-containing protein n=2 Tax=Georgenia subflava TaxID=1622177 RepID=A0A6N7ES15_9MICO|nr:WYL domain-containing protein [Georgenia subflava]